MATFKTYPLIGLKDISFGYAPEETVLEGIDFNVFEGDRIHLKGPNGVGKTTLFYLILGLLRPKSGHVELFGQICQEEKDFFHARSRIGFLFQDPDHQLFCPTVLEDVCFGPMNHGMTKEEAIKRANEVLDSLGISHLAQRPPYQLSGGEKKLAALATILSMDPEILLLDEPFNGLDPKARQKTVRILEDFKGKALVIVSHYERMPRGLINKVAYLKRDGVLVQEAFSTGSSTKKVVPFPG